MLIDVDRRCPEGNVTCEDIVFRIEDKHSKEVMLLAGTTWHTWCADRVTPCRFVGYKFHDGATTYWLQEEGLLEVVRNRKEVVLSEHGTWRY